MCESIDLSPPRGFILLGHDCLFTHTDFSQIWTARQQATVACLVLSNIQTMKLIVLSLILLGALLVAGIPVDLRPSQLQASYPITVQRRLN
jgi:hypothetical protein